MDTVIICYLPAPTSRSRPEVLLSVEMFVVIKSWTCSYRQIYGFIYTFIVIFANFFLKDLWQMKKSSQSHWTKCLHFMYNNNRNKKKVEYSHLSIHPDSSQQNHFKWRAPTWVLQNVFEFVLIKKKIHTQ